MRRPGALTAEPSVTAVPLLSSLAATGLTGVLALVGRARPGTFLKSAALAGTLGLSYTTCKLYGRRELNRGVFKLDKIEVQPGKLWESTEHWTVEDATLTGGGLGALAALNERAFPGAHGWQRFLGSALVGAALGSVLGQRLLVPIPPGLISKIDQTQAVTRHTHYERLQHNEAAKANLSRFGKLALRFYTWPAVQLLRGLTGAEAGREKAMSGAQGASPQSASSLFGPQSQNTLSLEVEFEQGELNGPDMTAGVRTYQDSLRTRNARALETYLAQLSTMRTTMVQEARYVWHVLAEKEKAYYAMVEESDEKDICRRELDLLGNAASQFVMREAVISFHMADARKQLEQIPGRINKTTSASDDTTLLLDQTPDTHYNPEFTTKHLRAFWTKQKAALAQVEQILSQYEVAVKQNGDRFLRAPGEIHGRVEAARVAVKNLRGYLEATSRLLAEFEERGRKAEKMKGKGTWGV